ncbi:hypothetical protein SAICODRAFT_26503 [Saitoella complicata NRRL Y-17804]|uniref:uncharacterized protein n=1 Tax=Saitoella complicata (strain BCRC 22490 / CBS 7301 / JCM 7358 / NBRC 10748 / NRRL Y-17804) TaxID=698492 RepID=UPI0008675612|nr:uncharacterized protein SAICODRAFT_26503 [Saitoella complicata NRRL Y-17804]ODQ51756.1 hypothetical protein SAICODRAFT_26503 [Saitoella complicata NRRL Y-17804]
MAPLFPRPTSTSTFPSNSYTTSPMTSPISSRRASPRQSRCTHDCKVFYMAMSTAMERSTAAFPTFGSYNSHPNSHSSDVPSTLSRSSSYEDEVEFENFDELAKEGIRVKKVGAPSPPAPRRA